MTMTRRKAARVRRAVNRIRRHVRARRADGSWETATPIARALYRVRKACL